MCALQKSMELSNYGNKVRKIQSSNLDHGDHAGFKAASRQDVSIGVNLTGIHSTKAIAVAKGLCAKTSNEGLTMQILSTQLFYVVNMFPQLTA